MPPTSPRQEEIEAYIFPPTHIGLALLQYHTYPPEDTHRLIPLAALNRCITSMALGKEDVTKWGVMLECGLLKAVLGVLFDGYLCGFTKAELTEWPKDIERYKKSILPYIYLAMSAFMDILGFSWHYCTEAKCDPLVASKTLENVDVIFSEVYRLWQALWDIRTPFLDSQPKGMSHWNGSTSPQLLQHIMITSSNVLMKFAERFRAFLPSSTKPFVMPQVLLAVWIHCYDKKDRERALDAFWRSFALHERVSSSKRYVQFYHEAIKGSTCTGPRQITQAALRDMRARKNVAPMLDILYQVVLNLRPTEHHFFSMKEQYQRRLLFASIAGCRSAVCMSKNATFLTCEPVFVMTYFFLQGSLCQKISWQNYPGLLAEHRVHAVIALLAKFQTEAMEIGNTPYIEESRKVAAFCIEMLGEHRRARTQNHGEAGLPLLRKHSRWAWKTAMDKVRSRGFHNLHKWSEMIRIWTLLGKALEAHVHGTAAPDPEEVRQSFPILERCRWKDCMCSIFEPHHKLQPCKGCYRVAYCNTMCQAKDWIIGGHKSRCGSTSFRKPSNRSAEATTANKYERLLKAV